MTPPGNHPFNRKASPLCANTVPSSPLERPQGPKRKKCGQSSAPPVDPARTSLKEQGPPPPRRSPTLDAVPPGPRWAQPPSGHIPALTLRVLPRAPPGPFVPPTKAPMQEPPWKNRTRPRQIRPGTLTAPRTSPTRLWA